MSTKLQGLNLNFQTVVDTIDLFVEEHNAKSKECEKNNDRRGAISANDIAIAYVELKMRLLLIASGNPNLL